MSFEAQLELARRQATNDDLAELARAALAEGEEERALPLLEAAVQRPSTARLWQWKGLLERSLDRHEAAIDSLARAAELAPDDAGIAHGLARVTLEAGAGAVERFERARQLAPTKGDVLIGRAAALLAAGRGEEAAAELDTFLAGSPLWLQGHAQLAQLRALLGQPELATASLERALAASPGNSMLWAALMDLHLRREDYAALRETAGRSLSGSFREHAAIAAAELGESERADALFAGAGDTPILRLWRIRHLLRTGQAGESLPLIDRELASERAAAAWPYAAAAWRLTGDPRGEWLNGDPRLVAAIDLADALPLDRLAVLLRSLHVARGEYLDQSVRGGTQTDGPLLSRIESEIRALRAAIVVAVQQYLKALPPTDPRHPLLGKRRDRLTRFAGSWSVRLRGGGHHANHVHPQGWISSALYVSLPERRAGEPEHSGWLTLGEPQAQLGLALPPTRLIEPKPGRLVLFPSWMWHGTLPFAEGERLTVAFDVAPPR